jgi:hypothetical protein
VSKAPTSQTSRPSLAVLLVRYGIGAVLVLVGLILLAVNPGVASASTALPWLLGAGCPY